MTEQPQQNLLNFNNAVQRTYISFATSGEKSSEKKNKTSKEFVLYFLENGDSLQDGKQRGG